MEEDAGRGRCFGPDGTEVGAARSSPLTHPHAGPPSELSPCAAAEVPILRRAGGRCSAVPAASATHVHGHQQTQEQCSCGCPSWSGTVPTPELSAPLAAAGRAASEPPLHVAGEEAAPRPSQGLAPPGSPGITLLPLLAFCRALRMLLQSASLRSEDTEEKDHPSDCTLL